MKRWFPPYGGQQAVRSGKWKGIRQQMTKGRGALELYNLEADPTEAKDVAADHPDVVKRLEGLLRSEHIRSEQFPLPAVDIASKK